MTLLGALLPLVYGDGTAYNVLFGSSEAEHVFEALLLGTALTTLTQPELEKAMCWDALRLIRRAFLARRTTH